MIPVLMTPVWNRWDLADKMLDSVDEEVGKLLIIDNRGSRPDVRIAPGRTANVWRPPYTGIGYGGAINYMITQTPDAPWWLWASNDVVFHPGHLASVARRMDEAQGPRVISGGFAWGAINPDVVDGVGLIDDWSFFPIYFDDNDYHRRCLLGDVEWIEDREGWTHGDGMHAASLTIRSEPSAEASNHVSFRQNAIAYQEKWGGLPGNEKFETPWDSGLPLWATKPDISGRRTRQW